MKTFILTILIILSSGLSVFAEEDFENLYEEAALEEETADDQVLEEEEPAIGSEEEVVTELATQDFYTLEIVQESQSAFDKYVPLIVRITPNETPVKTQITWTIQDNVKTKIRHPEFIEGLVKDQTYEYKMLFKPSNPGLYEITVNVTAWQRESNYTSSDSILLEFNEDLVIDPDDSTYKTMSIVKVFVIIIGIGGLSYLAFIGGKKLLKILKEYLKPPEL